MKFEVLFKFRKYFSFKFLWNDFNYHVINSLGDDYLTLLEQEAAERLYPEFNDTTNTGEGIFLNSFEFLLKIFS